MAKGGKGRKGGGGGGAGPKQRKYERDNNGRFASTGSGGATARGGRLLTAKGNKRTARALAGKTKTIEAAGQKGVLAKPKGLKPGAIKPKPAANKVVASPRRLSGDQKIARDVMTNKKLTSDRQRIAEMQRRGIKPGTDMVGLVAGVRAKQGGGTTARIKPAAKLPREQRLARAMVTAKRIDKKLQAKADEAGAAFAERRRISSRASSKARTAAFGKEAVAGKASATASRASQRSNARVTRLNEEKGKYAQAARGAATKPATKPAPKSPEPAVKIAKRKPKTPAEIAAGREADRREMASILRKPARWLTPTPAAKPAAPKPASTAAERIKIKTPIRRAMSTNRASVVTPGQRSRLETGKGAKTKGARLNSSVAKPRTAGNTKPQVASRVKRKLAAENAKMNKIVGAERVGARQGKQYERSLKRQTTLERAKTFLESGKLPGKDNSIAAQRNTKQARQRLAAKNAKRRTAATKPAAARRKSVGSISEAKAGRIIRRIDANRPGLRRASGSARKTANAIRTQQRATDFALAASARGRKQGKNLSVNQSLQRAIKNASAKRKPRPMR